MAAPVARTPRAWPFALFLVFVLGYNVFRVALFAMTETGAVTSDRPLDPLTLGIIVYSELAIGIAGLVAVPGLVWSRVWGFWLTVAVNVYAIVFDAAAAVAVQLSAAGGIIPPVAILVLLAVFRPRFFPSRMSASAAAAAKA